MDGNNLFNEYKRYFSNKRVFSSSNFKSTNQGEIDKVYSYLSKEQSKLFNQMKYKDTPIYVQIEEMIKKGLFTFEYEENHQVVLDSKAIIKYLKNNYKRNEVISIKKDGTYKKRTVGDNFNELKSIIRQDVFNGFYIGLNKIKQIKKAYYHPDKKTKLEIYSNDDFIQTVKTDLLAEKLLDYIDY